MLEHLMAGKKSLQISIQSYRFLFKQKIIGLYLWKQNFSLFFYTITFMFSGEFSIPNPVVHNINLQDAVETWLRLKTDPIPNFEPFQLLLQRQ